MTAPANGSSSSASNLAFTGTAGTASSDASALTVSIAPDPNAGPLEMYDYDEFGVPDDSGTLRRCGYLGGKARSTELATGVMSMGARSYVPALGRFLQVDPVDGGSANPYDYVNQDPFNTFDLTGTRPAGPDACSGPLCTAYSPSHKYPPPPDGNPLTALVIIACSAYNAPPPAHQRRGEERMTVRNSMMTSVRRVRANPIYQNVISALCVDGVLLAWSPFHRTWLNVAAALALVVVLAFLGWLDVRDARREGDGAS